MYGVCPMQQLMLIAPYLCGHLLCGSPALQQLAHRSDNCAVSALVNQEQPNMCRPHIAHTQHMRFANIRQSGRLEHTSETPGHVEVVAFGCRHATRRAHANLLGLLFSYPSVPAAIVRARGACTPPMQYKQKPCPRRSVAREPVKYQLDCVEMRWQK